MGFEHQVIRLSQIADGDFSFKISTQNTIDALAASIDRFGLINAPILACRRETYIIISGFRRIAACRYLGWGRIPARVLAAQTPFDIRIQVAVVDNTAHRELNLVEQARVVHLLAEVGHDPDSLVKKANAMGMAINAKMLDKLHKINLMPKTLHQGLINSSISLPTALRVFDLPDPAAQENLSLFLQELNLSLNRQRELIDWIEAIARKDHLTINQLLAEEQLCRWRHDESMDRPQKVRRIREYLRVKCFPALSAARKRYEAACRQLKLKNGIHLVPPENFEGTTHSIHLNFNNADALADLADECRRLAQSPLLNDLLDPFDLD